MWILRFKRKMLSHRAISFLTNYEMNNKITIKSWVEIPPLVIIGAILILVPIFLFLTLDSINRQRESTAT